MRYFLITVYDVNVTWWLSTYVKELSNILTKNWIENYILTPFTHRSFLFWIFVFFLKVLYVCNNYIGLRFYYALLYIKIRHDTWKYNINRDDFFHFQDVISTSLLDVYDNKHLLSVHWELVNMNLSDWIIKPWSKWEIYCRSIEKKAYSSVCKIISVDSKLKDYIKWYWVNITKVKIFFNFTNISRFFPIWRLKKNILKEKYHIPTQKHILFCPRRLVEKNGVILTIEILEKLSCDFHLVIVWKWPELKHILEKIEVLWIQSRVTILGDIDNQYISEYYQLSDMVIIPSIVSFGLVEATSISMLESMSCWVPVIASSIWGLKEVISHGEDGFLVEEKNIWEFTDVIEHYFSLPQKEKENISENARKKIESSFSSESYFKKLMEYIWK
jgi:glycosyltransferase involved in cell wall biosynthesis